MAGYDHVVIGAGIVGSWTAFHLAKNGKKVLLLEQFNEPHTRGSSHGQSRLIRSAYSESFFAEMMTHAFDMWHLAEIESGEKLIEKTGVLGIFRRPEEDDKFEKVIACMKTYCPENLDLENLRDDLFTKELRYNKKSHAFLFDKSGGVILAHKAVLTLQELFRKAGGQIRHNCQVRSIVPKGNDVEINTNFERLVIPSVVVCAGPWTKKLLVPSLIPDLPIQPTMVKVYYWKEKEIGAHSIAANFPAIIDQEDPHVYAIPSKEYPGLLKVCVHGGSPCDPDKRDQAPINQKLDKRLRDYVAEHFPLLEKEPAILETCMYTVTPDEIFLIDRIPGHKNIIIGTGFSGTGFKTAPVVGRLLGEMAEGNETFLDISPYRLSRFA